MTHNELLLDEFLRKINEKWAEMREKGKSVKMEFSLSGNSGITMNEDIPSKGEKLKYVIEDWLEETAFKKLLCGHFCYGDQTNGGGL